MSEGQQGHWGGFGGQGSLEYTLRNTALCGGSGPAFLGRLQIGVYIIVCPPTKGRGCVLSPSIFHTAGTDRPDF